MRTVAVLAAMMALLSIACITDYVPAIGDKTQTMDGAGAKFWGYEGAASGYGSTPDPYTASQACSYDNRAWDSPSPKNPVVIENMANDGFGAFSRDGLKDRDGHGTLNHKGWDSGLNTLHTFKRSVLCIDTASTCEFAANVVRDNSGTGPGLMVCFTAATELVDSFDYPLNDSEGNRLQTVDDVIGMLVKSRLNAGDTSMDLKLQKMTFGDGSDFTFSEPLNIGMGDARLQKFSISADGNRSQMVQLIRHLKRTGFKTGDPVRGLDFGDFRIGIPESVTITLGMDAMDKILVKFVNELRAERMRR